MGEWKEEDRRADERSRSREAIRIGERLGESVGAALLPLLLAPLNAFEELLLCEELLCAVLAGAERNPALFALLLLLSAAAAAAVCLSLTGLFGGDGDVSLWFAL